MNDERFLKDWLEDEAPDSSGARKSADQIKARLPETKQRSRWWPMLPSRRSSPRPSDDGEPPTINGSTRFMFSPAKAITAGALVFAIGGVLLIAQPFEQQGGVPGAATEAIAPTWVTGTVQPASSCSADPLVLDGDVTHEWNVECSPQTWTSSDPRFTGEVVRRWNYDVYQTDEGTIEINMDAAYLRNDDGDWACSGSNLFRGSGSSSEGLPGPTFTHTCIGGGGYEGLSAILESEDGPANTSEFVGLVFSGDFPPLPEPPAVE